MPEQTQSPGTPEVSAGRVGKRVGNVSELTVIAPFKPGGAAKLRAKIAKPEVGPSFEEKVGTLHNSRFVIVDDDTRLLFATEFDGDWDTYIDDFVRLVPEVLDYFFSDIEGWPGIHDPSVKDYIADHQVTAEYWWSAYPDASVKDVRRGQRIAKALDGLLDAAQ
jgi:hypothetical protein